MATGSSKTTGSSNLIDGKSTFDPVEAGLNEIIVTELLHQRPSRTPDYAAESEAFLALAQTMAESPLSILQKLVDTAVDLTGADSAGISVLETNAGNKAFRWRATAGEFFPFAQGTLPRDFSPCGLVLDRNAPQLMSDPVRFYPYIAELRPHVCEVLLVPFHRGATPIGTVWIVAHTPAKRFDAEDMRIITHLAKFASAAMQMVSNVEAAEAHAQLLAAEVAERERIEDALRQSEERFRRLADAMPQMVWVTRPDGYHEYYNRRWYEFTGMPEGSTDGEGWNGMFHPDDQDRAWAAWRRSLATGEAYEIEYRLRHHSGEYRWTLGRAMPVADERGRITRWFGTCTDIDTLKRLMVERESLLERERSARAEAETASRAKDKFLAVLSHELRTPLSPVAMAATAMELDPRLPSEFREDVAMIRRNVDLETRLIDDLLDVSRVVSGKLRLNPEPLHVHRTIQHVLETVGGELHGKQLRVERELAASNDLVNADPARLQQTLWNLLKNAGKFTPSGGRIIVKTHNAGDALVVEVTDTGKGIAPEVLTRIFEPFEQGEAEVTRRYGGMGLGLAIAKAVVDGHGGTLSAFSKGLGKGATFTISLPLGRDEATEARTTSDVVNEIPANWIRVLLVEDDEDSAKMLVRLLRIDGTDVQWAGTVAAAVELASSGSFDVVVSDLDLPDGSGHDLIKRLLSERPVRAIAVSGYGMEDDIRESREAGFAEHLVKPVNLPQLREAIRRVASIK